MKCFLWQGELFIRAVPGKHLFRSTMVHDVVNRGDIFAIRVKDQILTIIPGEAEVQHVDRVLAGQVENPAAPISSEKQEEFFARELAEVRGRLNFKNACTTFISRFKGLLRTKDMLTAADEKLLDVVYTTISSEGFDQTLREVRKWRTTTKQSS